MFQEINAECYIMVDGDDTYPAEDAPAMAKKSNDKVDMVVGDDCHRHTLLRNKGLFHNFGNSR